MEIFLRYAGIAAVGLLILLLAPGCTTINKASSPWKETPTEQSVGSGVQMGKPLDIRPLVRGGGPPVAVGSDADGDGEVDDATLIGYQASGGQFGEGVVFGTDDIAMQMGLMAQGLPTENWFQAILPDLFGPNIEEVRSDVVMYGARLQMWALTVAEMGPVVIGGTTIRQELLSGDTVTIETPAITTAPVRFPTSQPPAPPESLSGLQRLGVNGSMLISGLISFFAFDFAKSNEPTVVETPPAQIIEVPTPTPTP